MSHKARKYGSSNSVSKSANSVIGGEIGERIKQKISQELSQYAASGWYVDELLDIFSNDPMLAAKLLGTLRNEITNHATFEKAIVRNAMEQRYRFGFDNSRRNAKSFEIERYK